jgi:hypothetical protein
MQGRPVGDWIVLIFSLLMVVGLVLAYFISLMRDKYNPVAMCQRSDITYRLLGAVGFVGMVLTLESVGPSWLYGSLTVVGAPVLLALPAFALFTGRRAQETILQWLLAGSLVALVSVTWPLISSQSDRLIVVGYMTGATLGWLILERKKRFLLPDKNGMVQVQVVELIEEDETR